MDKIEEVKNIQRKKSSCITLISDEGAGKTSLIYLLSKLWEGRKYWRPKIQQDMSGGLSIL